MKEEKSFIKNYFDEVNLIIKKLNINKIEELVNHLKTIHINKGRIFVIGVGGSAANASHFVNDLRKICSIECYNPADNVAELTARTNDDGWQTIFSSWLKVSKINKNDALFVLSVGGGNEEKNVSQNIVEAIKHAKLKRAKIFSIVGRNDGYAANNSDISIIIPIVNEIRITPHSESFQSIIWHCLVSHPLLQVNKTKW